jgi:transcription initiation factor IIE alpha subunit
LHEKDPAIAGAPGRFVSLDAAARRMFYRQSGRPCPVCGQQGGRRSSSSATTQNGSCGECGGALDRVPERPPFDDLDDLVNQLDQQMQRRL